jgi:hypothetical protein
MNRYCVFCGKFPEEQTKEHVLPVWLIEMTGDPKRQARFGLKKNPNLTPRVFSYDSFTIPACDACNQLFSKLESSTKPIMERLTQGSSLFPKDFSILFDWFDKVRVALWLAHSVLDKNFFGIHPSFHVEKRLRAFDRVLGVFRSDQSRRGLTFIGTETPIFYSMPSCFSLVVNDFAFFNASSAFMISRRTGFPFPSSATFVRSGAMSVAFTRGRERLMHPLLRKPLDPRASYAFQPMFPNQAREQSLRRFYDTPYIKSHSIDWINGIGGIFLQGQRQTTFLSSLESIQWMPREPVPLHLFARDLTKFVLSMQIDLFQNSASLDGLSPQERATFKKFSSTAIRFNKDSINQLKRDNGANA